MFIFVTAGTDPFSTQLNFVHRAEANRSALSRLIKRDPFAKPQTFFARTSPQSPSCKWWK